MEKCPRHSRQGCGTRPRQSETPADHQQKKWKWGRYSSAGGRLGGGSRRQQLESASAQPQQPNTRDFRAEVFRSKNTHVTALERWAIRIGRQDHSCEAVGERFQQTCTIVLKQL
ncbi:MAG: hypothetical protein L3J67_13040 [Hyphomicrobiaceae bacterium]|nr:hypothetical protein [Hyphomicrobiaceae bacterium]